MAGQKPATEQSAGQQAGGEQQTEATDQAAQDQAAEGAGQTDQTDTGGEQQTEATDQAAQDQAAEGAGQDDDDPPSEQEPEADPPADGQHVATGDYLAGLARGAGMRTSEFYFAIALPEPEGLGDQPRMQERAGYRAGVAAAEAGQALPRMTADQYLEWCQQVGFGRGYVDGRSEYLRQHPEEGE